MKPITIAFDVDGTLRDNIVNQDLQPVANEDIRSLLIILSKFKNVKIMVWSGGGELYARQVVESLGLNKYVDEFTDKKYRVGPDGSHHFETRVKPDIAIDDIQECTLGVLNLIVRQK
jgi:phosphoglycolate phosphatase-like HAD superfamily hydrolase